MPEHTHLDGKDTFNQARLKVLMTWITTMVCVITNLESDILGCKARRALGSITTNKASGGDGIPADLFQNLLKDDAVKVLHSICQQIWKTTVAKGLEKISFHSNPKERQCQRMLKLWHNCVNCVCELFISHTSKVMLKILQTRLQQYLNQELPDVQAGLRKGRGTRDQIANIHWIIEKAREFQKNSYFCFIDYAK